MGFSAKVTEQNVFNKNLRIIYQLDNNNLHLKYFCSDTRFKLLLKNEQTVFIT